MNVFKKLGKTIKFDNNIIEVVANLKKRKKNMQLNAVNTSGKEQNWQHCFFSSSSFLVQF